MSRRFAVLSAVTVEVLCPYCGEAQPIDGDSDAWTLDQVQKAAGRRKCVSCDEEFLLCYSSSVLR